MEAAAAVLLSEEPSSAKCWRCKVPVEVVHTTELWSKDPVDLYAEHTREESSFICDERGQLVRETRQVRCRASGEEIVR